MFLPATILYEHLKDQFHVSISTDKRGIKFLDKDKYNFEIFNVNSNIKNISFITISIFFNNLFDYKINIFFKKKKNKYINFNRWLYVLTFMHSIKNFKY